MQLSDQLDLPNPSSSSYNAFQCICAVRCNLMCESRDKPAAYSNAEVPLDIFSLRVHSLTEPVILKAQPPGFKTIAVL